MKAVARPKGSLIITSPNTRFDYELIRSRRRTLALEVHRDQRVIVRAPQAASLADIQQWVASKSNWILRKQGELEAQPSPPKPSYSNGSQHLFRGQSYTLKLMAANTIGVSLIGSTLQLPEMSPDGVQKCLQDWYRKQAQVVFKQRLDYWLERSPCSEKFGQLKIRRMVRRWGSCTQKGDITLNVHLIKAPEAILDFVICHELCHLQEMRHSSRFYKLLSQLYPDWKNVETELERLSTTLIPE